MAFLTFEEFKGFTNEGVTKKEFDRFSMKAELFLDSRTTTIDGVRKLREYFPTDEYDVLCIKNCLSSLIDTYVVLDRHAKELEKASGYKTTESGVQSKRIASISAGSESITFSNDQADSWVAEIAKSKSAQLAHLSAIVADCLGSAKDLNGVNLRYLGKYPRRCKR